MPHDARLRIVVTGLIAQHPHLGGVAWDYLQYPVGLHRLGHDVYYIEDTGEWPYRLEAGEGTDPWAAADCAKNLDHLHRCLDRFGLGNRWAYRNAVDGQWYGLSEQQRETVLGSADLLLNVSGTIDDPERLQGPATWVYIDSDPGFTQVKYAWSRAGLRMPMAPNALEDPRLFSRRVDAHDRFFSFGETLGAAVPATGHDWAPTRQPILVDEWHSRQRLRDCFTTVMSWASYPPVESDGRVYGQKDMQFRQYLTLPQRTSAELEVAMNTLMHAQWETGAEAGTIDRSVVDVLEDHAWRVVDAGARCHDLDSYRDYIKTSMAEWSVAKHGYVASRTGWFSCRSACYLAAGRPVVVEDTGFSDVLPSGEGLIAFSDLDEAVAGLQLVQGDYERQATAATEIAREHFASERVLQRLIHDAYSSGLARTGTGALSAAPVTR